MKNKQINSFPPLDNRQQIIKFPVPYCHSLYSKIIFFLQYLYKTSHMNNFNPYVNFYYQFWVVPKIVTNATPIYTPIAVYPQIMQPQTNNLIINPIFSDLSSKLTEHKQKPIEKSQIKSTSDETTQKSEAEKITVQLDSNFSKQQSNKNQQKKAKRPQTYLTEKAFYMKQKLKGKQKNGCRILRRRLKRKQIEEIKGLQIQKSGKKSNQGTKIYRKKMPIMKDSEKERKIVNKIKLRLLKQYNDEFAEIPKLISGVTELNEFCRNKLQKLMSRQTSFD